MTDISVLFPLCGALYIQKVIFNDAFRVNDDVGMSVYLQSEYFDSVFAYTCIHKTLHYFEIIIYL